MNTFSIDENLKKNKKKGGGGGVSGHESQKILKNSNHDSRKLKFAIFENFTIHGESIRDINRGSREKKIPQSQIMGENGERENKMHAW